MLTESDEKLICELVSIRYETLREVHALEKQAHELQQKAKEKRESVKNITLRKIAAKFDTTQSTVMRKALDAGIDLTRPRRTW